jgi:hypothetical protein
VKKGEFVMKRISSNLLAASCCAASLICMSSTVRASEIVISNPVAAPTPTDEQPSPGANKDLNAKVDLSNKSKGTATKNTSGSIPNSSGNYLDDRLAWPSAIEAKASLGGDVADGYCIPANTKVIGAHAALDTDVQQTTTTGSKTAGQTAGTSTSQFQAVTLDTSKPILGLFGEAQPNTLPAPQNHAAVCPDVTNPQTFEEGALAYISAGDMNNVGYRAGFDYGALAVPFKLQLTGGKAYTGSASLGAYLGYQNPIGNWGINVTPMIFAGVSDISTAASTGSTTTSQTVAGLSYGGGFLFQIKDSFQAGVVLGFDHVTSAQTYQYNDKPWISLQLGYSFAN